jgi:hypothetical protein
MNIHVVVEIVKLLPKSNSFIGSQIIELFF